MSEQYFQDNKPKDAASPPTENGNGGRPLPSSWRGIFSASDDGKESPMGLLNDFTEMPALDIFGDEICIDIVSEGDDGLVWPSLYCSSLREAYCNVMRGS